MKFEPQSSGLAVRPALARDISAVTAIYRPEVLTGTATFELEPPDEAEMERRRQTLVGSGYPYIVAERSGALLGYAYAGPFRARPAYRFSVEDSIYVDPQVQGQGVGRLLLTELIRLSTDLGFRKMIAVIGDSSVQVASIALHRATGFEPAGTLEGVGYKHGRWLDTLTMQRALGPGAATPPSGIRS